MDVTDNGEIVFAFEFLTDSGFSLGVSRLLDDGSIDRGFGNNGFFIRPDTFNGLVQLTPDGGVAIGFTNGDATVDDAPFNTLGIPSLILLNPDGQISSEILITPSAADINNVPNFIDVGTRSLAVDQSGNIFLSYGRASFTEVVVRVTPSGQVAGESFLNSPVFGLGNDIIFDSSDRLVVVGQNISRFV